MGPGSGFLESSPVGFSGTSLETSRDRLESEVLGERGVISARGRWRPHGVLMSTAFDRQSDHI